MNNLRSLMLWALLLDWLGQVLIFVCILAMSPWTGVDLGADSLQVQGPWFLFVLLLYPLLGWLFGSYTVLRWRRLTLPLLLQRLLITGAVTLMVVAIARWLINPSEMVWFTGVCSFCGSERCRSGCWRFALGRAAAAVA